MKNWFARPVCSSNPKKICSDPDCPVGAKWLGQLIGLDMEIR